MFLTHEDGYYALTAAGTLLIIFLAVSALHLIMELQILNAVNEKRTVEKLRETFTTKKLVFAAAALALGFVTSYIRIIHMPWGGSVTLCSMLFIVLIGYWYGPRVGLTAAFAYGLLQFIQGGGSYILSPLQACLDYILAFTALGLSGFFRKNKNGLVIGYLVAILARGALHSIGGYLYWMDYMPDSFPKSLAPIYPIAYNYAYILIEGAITVVLISIPAVKKALERIRLTATE